MISSELVQIISPAILIGILISLTHGMLGIKVLKRGIIFIDLAIAQIAGLGIITAKVLLSENIILLQIFALTFAISSGLFFFYIEKKIPDLQEAIIGCSFILAASLSILLLSNHPHGADEMIHLLSGQILFVTFSDIIFHSPIYLFIIIIWLKIPALRSGVWFYLIFAIAITSSVQLVGIYVVFASLILPAIAARGTKSPIAIVWLCGIISVALGMFFAVILDLSAGNLIVIFYFLNSIFINFFLVKFNLNKNKISY